MRDPQIEIRDFDTIPMVPCYPGEIRRRAYVQRVLRRSAVGSLFWWFVGAAALVTIALSTMCQQPSEFGSGHPRSVASDRR